MLIRAVLSACILISSVSLSHAEEIHTPAEKLLQTSTTVLGQPLRYPTTGAAEITAVIVTMKPGEKTANHLHEAPILGYILEGEMTVHYDGHGTKVYKAGDAVTEAIDVWHVGENTGAVPMRVLVVFMGAEGTKNTVVHD